MLIFNLIIFIFGLVAGSFLNAVIWRLEKKESALKGRSYCPKCRHNLGWQDLIPVFSFVVLGGKCRYCGKKISWRYPLVELATGVLFVLVSYFALPTVAPQYLIFNTSYLILYTLYFIIVSLLVVIFVYDLKHYIIPDKIVYPAIIIAFLYRLFEFLNLDFIWNLEFEIWNFKPLAYILLSAFGASAFFLIIILVSRGRWMGMGDAKLAFLMGLLLGFPNIVAALFISFFLGAIIGTGMIVAGKKKIKSEIPFGPFLVAGTFLSLFWGQDLVGWYLNLIGYSAIL